MAAPAARRPDVWYRTAARPGSKPCDACKRPVGMLEPIAYRRPSSGPRTSDLLCETCARREPFVDERGRETGRSIWDEAKQATTAEARGQIAFTDALLAGKTIGEAKAAQEAEDGPDWDQMLERAELATEESWEAVAAAQEALDEALRQHKNDRVHLARVKRGMADGDG